MKLESITSSVAAAELTPASKTKKKKKKKKKEEATPESNEIPCKEKLTPYQGKRRSFGYFHCEACDKEWTSANSWANCYQKCRECKQIVYPYRQHKLWVGTGQQQRRPHPRELCQRCTETGRPCWGTEWS